MPLAVGRRVGPYEVTGPLGSGGMGEVWRARDSRLARDVAIKVLPAALADDPERRARFQRECRLLASLSHPHVAAVLGLEDADGMPALVMELVEGPTLADRLARNGAIPLDEALAVARQVAEALEYSHERGIVHRDLKPANVKLAPDGSVKVLDFGLAKALATGDSSSSSPSVTQSPTISIATDNGILLGTAPYMSPEQARGKAVDRRTDIWAFGVLLYEMLTRRQMFAGETVSDILARILERDPDWRGLPARLPARVREMLRRCLEKDPMRRLRDIGDARLELEAAIASPAAEGPGPDSWRRLAPLGFVFAGVVLLLAGYGLQVAMGPRRSPPLHFSIVPQADLVVQDFSFSADGNSLLASAVPRGRAPDVRHALYRRKWDSFDWQEVPGTAGWETWNQSSDGRWLYLVKPVAEGSRRSELLRVPADGSAPPVSLMPWLDSYSWWVVLPDGRVAILEGGFKRFGIGIPGGAGLQWKPISCERDLVGLQPTQTLPDGRTVLVNARYFGPNGWTETAGVLELDTGKVVVLEERAGNPRLASAGRLVMTRNGTLLAAPWDAGRRRLSGPPVAVMQGLGTDQPWEHAYFATSPSGDLAYAPGGARARQRSLVVLRRDGRVEPWSEEHRAFEQAPAVSADGRLVAAIDAPPGSSTYEVLLLERGRPGARRFAFAENEDCSDPVFSPDGRWLAWSRQGGDSTGGLYLQPLDGHVPARRLLATRGPAEWESPKGWMPDGRSILVESRRPRQPGGGFRYSLRRVTLAGDSAIVSDVVHAPYNVTSGAISPDGRRIAYVSAESGSPQVVVATIRPDGRAGDAVPVSQSPGIHPTWADGGASLLWSASGGVVMEIHVSGALELSAPRRRADVGDWATSPGAYVPLPGGDLLVTRKSEGEGEVRHIDVVQGFRAELERIVKGSGRNSR